MAKRFTDTTIWKNQKWFKKLDPIHKLAWKYLTDVCDHAGIWKIDIGELTDDLGLEEFSLEDFMSQCNTDYDKKTGKKISRKRLLIVKEEYLWLTGFIKFQYEGKNRKVDGTSKVANSAIEILNGFGLLAKAIEEEKFFELKINELSPSKPLQAPPSPIGTPLNPLEPLEGGKDKERDKDKRKDEKEIQGGVGEKMLCPEMIKVFKESYPEYPVDFDTDKPHCWQIACKIASEKKWTVESLTNGNLANALLEWRAIVVFSKADPWYSTRAISDFNKEYQRLRQKMINSNGNGIHKQTTSGVGKTMDFDKP